MSWHHSLKTSPNSFDSVSFMVLVTRNRKTLKHGAVSVASKKARFWGNREGRGGGQPDALGRRLSIPTPGGTSIQSATCEGNAGAWHSPQIRCGP